jgi:ABC-type transport system involved in multi-copper enzyme maturation permease subunit
MNAFDSEVRRLLARRLIRILFLLLIAGFVVAGIVAFFNSANEVTRFETPQGFEGEVFVDDQRFHLRDFLTTAEEVSGLLVLFFLVLGASAIGAEWPSRSMTSSLTFEPRRGVLLTSKLSAVLLTAFVGAIAVQLLLLVCMLPAAFLRGTTTGVDGSWAIDLIETMVRVGFISAFGSVLGFAIATIGRNTGAALGAAFLYFAILESLLRAWKPEWSEWLLGDNLAVVATGEPQGFSTRGPTGAAILLAIYGVLIYVGALAFFKRRDIA